MANKEREMLERRLGQRQIRCKPGEFRAIENENGEKFIEGYFAVFNSNYEIGPGMTESIDPAAFDETISGDVRCLTDHDTRLVLGRTTAKTFELEVDQRGLFGRVRINPNDTDATNTHARVERRDVTQASFGFDILDEETDYRQDGSIHWTIKKVKLYECSVVTFPAYLDTDLSARSNQLEQIKKREREKWAAEMRSRLTKDRNDPEQEE